MCSKKNQLCFIFGFVFFFIAGAGNSQFINLSRSKPYQQVFIQTDAFDSSYLTQMEEALTHSMPDTLRLAIGNDLAYYWHTRNLDKALALANKYFGLALSLNDVIGQGRLQVTLAAILLRKEKLDTAFSVLESAKARLPKKEWSLLLTSEGYVMERQGRLDKAADYAMEGLALGDSLNDLRTIAMAYSDLSNLFWKQSRFDKGIEYGLRSEEAYKQRNIKDMDYSFTLYVIGNNYMALNDYPKAVAYYNRASAMSEEYGFYNNLADIYIALADLYTVTRDYTKAQVAINNAIRYSDLLDNNFLLMRSWLSKGKLENLTRQSQAAVQSLQTCLQIATDSFHDKFFLQQVYVELANAYAATNDFKNAFAAFRKHDQLEDSVFTAESDERVATLQTELEVAQKENTIEAQNQAISQQKNLQLITLVAAAFLVLFLILLYRNYSHKKRANTKLEALNEILEQKNSQLDKRNAENELLLKEIHHRVKNNLEIVSGLLALQAAQTDHPSAQAVMQASQNRVLSMGIIHQKLYQKGNLAAIEMKDYFQNLGESILDTFNATNRVCLQCEMQPIELDVDTAVPLGLIANELLTNALKYAFPGEENGKITISLAYSAGKNELVFLLSDNGIGKSENLPAKGTGFGTDLVNLLVQQLEGRLTTNNGNGTSITIHFKKTAHVNGHTD
ncbi:MAG TPA: histidine kinase dimerization/phosphoacceptor domain -containing protein [Panacibacter sp.]|nr:histidine kinase dimerization/phosphoacceptor domain -containing protein [Panacibacter sp.]HNP47130.1 histidine kinase dimerization/phosphoacceptor domain -containing protein [Panacibacter sp.]